MPVIKALIPARGGSQRIPGKNLYKINNKPLIDYTIDVLNSVETIDSVWVSSDDENILLHCGEKCNIIERPINLASNTSTTEDVIDHFIKNVECDIVVLVQCTSPLLKGVELEEGIKLFLDNIDKYDSAMSVYSLEINDMLLWKTIKDDNMTSINYNYNNRGRSQDRKDCGYVIETGSFYMFKTDMFNLSKNRLCGRILPIYTNFWNSFEIDEYDDLNNIKKLLS